MLATLGVAASAALAGCAEEVDGAYAIAGEQTAGAGHFATMQARGYDAAALSGMGGPSEGLTDAMTLATYRARTQDAAWLADAGDADAAANAVSNVFAHFEGARAHEALEEADHEAYEGFEGGLESLQSAVESGGGIADATATVDEGTGSDGESEGTERDPGGGPNVVSGVPEHADHVVDMTAAAFDPAEFTVAVGHTVAWKHAAGEAHSVTARENDLPGDAEYWASGGFDSEQAAVEGWDNGKGAVQSGQSYVHTFETTGEHPYYCVPHELAGMEGTVVVEE